MEKSALYSDSSDSDDINLDNYDVNRLASLNTETDDTSDGSDTDYRATRLETHNENFYPPKVRQTKSRTPSETHEDGRNDALPTTSDTNEKHPWEVPSSAMVSNSPFDAQGHSPEDDNELFTADYVDNLVASFWSKVDKKIETAVSQYHTSPQAGQQYISQENAQAGTNEAEKEPKEKKCPLSKSPGGICVFVLFIFQAINKIWTLCKESLKSKAKEWFTDGMWRDNLRAIITHRHANFTVVLVTLMDCFLVTANIFADFDIVDDNGIELIFRGFLYINLAVMLVFLFECFMRMIVFRGDLFQDKLEAFDVVLMIFYFLVEVFSSNGFSNVGNPYPKYLHMIVILRCWRIIAILEQLQEEKEAELVHAMESQTPR